MKKEGEFRLDLDAVHEDPKVSALAERFYGALADYGAAMEEYLEAHKADFTPPGVELPPEFDWGHISSLEIATYLMTVAGCHLVDHFPPTCLAAGDAVNHEKLFLSLAMVAYQDALEGAQERLQVRPENMN